ncbi:MAG: hypothetical protein E7335_06615 [Clostridiales bacterium]|nr:hypothetical protein [Clostridiales bacterium]
MEEFLERQGYSRIQIAIFWVSAALFMIFITLFIPAKYWWFEIVLTLVGIPMVALISRIFAASQSFLYNISRWKSVVHTGVAILLVPSIMTTIYCVCYSDYIKSIPSDDYIVSRIDIKVERIGGSSSVGNEWKYEHAINGIPIKDGEFAAFNIEQPFRITSTIIEDDDVDDVGKVTSSKCYFRKSGDNIGKITVTNKVKVAERGGSKNRSSYAVFLVEYKIIRSDVGRYEAKKIYPDTFDFFDVCFYDDAKNVLELVILSFGIECGIIAYVLLVINKSKKRKEQLQREREDAQRQKFQDEKRTFVARLGGKRLRDVAGVPENIIYSDGKPIDEGDEKYGSFTVYVTYNGTCFHSREGCCSSYKPVHYFDARKSYRPCLKCKHRYIDVPEWHIKYLELQKEARKYEIEE